MTDRPARSVLAELAEAGADRLTVALGGRERARVIVVLACVLGLSAADVSTVVVFPAPFGPRKAKISPRATSRSMPRTASVSP